MKSGCAAIKQRVHKAASLTRDSLLAANFLLNLVGFAIPLIAALFAIPVLINGLGIDRFGVLTLAWALIGYFSLFDFGVGRALTKVVAAKLGSGQFEEIARMTWAALVLMIVFGSLGALVLVLAAPWLIFDVLKIPEGLRNEACSALRVLALSIPLVTSTASMRGLLEAYQRFDLVNYVRIPMGIFLFAGPLIVLPYTDSLVWVVLVLAAGRLLASAVTLAFCLKIVPDLARRATLSLKQVAPLFRLGGWMTVSNIFGPIMVYLDRFMIASVIGVSAVAYYTTPYEVITKLWILPAALTGVLFPAFAHGLVSERAGAARQYAGGAQIIMLCLLPVVALVVAFSESALEIWLGEDFAAQSTIVLQVLAVGVFVNSLGHVPFALIQAAGRPDITAKIHLLELPLYLIVLVTLLDRFGIVGAASAWLLRVALDSALLFFVASILLPIERFLSRFALLAVGGVALLAFVATTSSVVVKVTCVLLLVLIGLIGISRYYANTLRPSIMLEEMQQRKQSSYE